MRHTPFALPRNTHGNVAVEAAVLLPLLIVIVMLTVDIVRYFDIAARMERVAATAADLTARNETLVDQVDFNAPTANNELGMLFLVSNESAFPDPLASNGRIYLSAIEIDDAGQPAILWQRTGPYGFTAASRLEPATIPALPKGTFIVAEVFYDYKPTLVDHSRLTGIVEPVLYRRAIFRPRLGALATLEPVGS